MVACFLILVISPRVILDFAEGIKYQCMSQRHSESKKFALGLVLNIGNIMVSVFSDVMSFWHYRFGIMIGKPFKY